MSVKKGASMRNFIFLLCCVFLIPGFIFQAIAQEPGDRQEARPVRTYPAESWMQQALDSYSQEQDLEFINYLYKLLTHHETDEELWEDALNTLIYVQQRAEKKSEDPDSSYDDSDVVAVNEQVYHVFAEVIADFDRTKGQRYAVLGIIGTSGAPSAVRILKNFVQYRPPADAGRC